MKYITLTLICLILNFIKAEEYGIRKLGEFRTRYPSHMTVTRLPHQNSSYSLIWTEFDGNPLTWSRINEVPIIANKIKSAEDIKNIKPRYITPNFLLKWANEVKRIPYNVFNADYIYNADGFLVPLHSDGDLYIIKVNPGQNGQHSFERPQPISQKKSTWFYHNAIFIDMNGDGRIDVLTARNSLKNGREKAEGELLWLEHPETNAEKSRWKEHVLLEGPDVSIKQYDFLKIKGQIQIVACQFWKKSTIVVNIELGKTPKVLWTNVVDNTIGNPYDVRFGDLNGDGKDELLITNHQNVPEESGLFAFEVPKDVRNGVFTKHVIRTGYVTRQPGQYEASPGFPFVFYPKTGLKGRPHIMVAGDGTQEAYYYYPIGETGFRYGGGAFTRLSGVVGDIGYADVDNDGFVELFVPNYHGGEIHVFKFYQKTGDEIFKFRKTN